MPMSEASKKIVHNAILEIVGDILETNKEAIVSQLRNRERIPQDPHDLLSKLDVWAFCEGSAIYDSANAVEYLEALDNDTEPIAEGEDWRTQIINAANAAIIAAVERVLRNVFTSLQEKVDEWYGAFTASTSFEYAFDINSDSLDINIMTDQYDVSTDENKWEAIYVPINY